VQTDFQILPDAVIFNSIPDKGEQGYPLSAISSYNGVLLSTDGKTLIIQNSGVWQDYKPHRYKEEKKRIVYTEQPPIPRTVSTELAADIKRL
jgi:hypothetical protein